MLYVRLHSGAKQTRCKCAPTTADTCCQWCKDDRDCQGARMIFEVDNLVCYMHKDIPMDGAGDVVVANSNRFFGMCAAQLHTQVQIDHCRTHIVYADRLVAKPPSQPPTPGAKPPSQPPTPGAKPASQPPTPGAKPPRSAPGSAPKTVMQPGTCVLLLLIHTLP